MWKNKAEERKASCSIGKDHVSKMVRGFFFGLRFYSLEKMVYD